MKITQKKIFQMTQSVLRGEKHYGEHLLLHPTREWAIGLLCFMVLCLGGAWWAATVYLRYIDVSALLGEGIVPEMTTYRSAQVSQALEILDERIATFETILGRYSGIVPEQSPDLAPPIGAGSGVASTTDGVSGPQATTTKVLSPETEVIEPASLDEVTTDEEEAAGVPTLVF